MTHLISSAGIAVWLPCLQFTCYDLGMCLGIPGKVIGIDGMEATVDFFGVRRQVRLDIVDEPVALGDYVLNHVGFAIRRIPESEVEETLKLFAELAAAGDDQDLLAADLRAELAATQEGKK
ncbi:MAG: HypC/HybG/HupF family hydrogenase formation chaperone [Polyangia bacterium]